MSGTLQLPQSFPARDHAVMRTPRAPVSRRVFLIRASQLAPFTSCFLYSHPPSSVYLFSVLIPINVFGLVVSTAGPVRFSLCSFLGPFVPRLDSHHQDHTCGKLCWGGEECFLSPQYGHGAQFRHSGNTSHIQHIQTFYTLHISNIHAGEC